MKDYCCTTARLILKLMNVKWWADVDVSKIGNNKLCAKYRMTVILIISIESIGAIESDDAIFHNYT